MSVLRPWPVVMALGLLSVAGDGATGDDEAPARRELVVTARYLHLPVKTGAPKRRMRFEVGGTTVREFEIELADGKPDFWAFSDVSGWRGRRLTIAVDGLPAGSPGLAAIDQGDDLKG